MKSSKYITNFLWRVVETCSTQVVGFVVSVILARLIAPGDFGALAIVTVFISLCNIFIDGGFGMALVQKKDADDLDFSSVFYFNIAMCLALYAIIFLCSPLIAGFYEMPMLIPVIRVQSIGLLVSGVRSIQTAYVSRHLLFKRSFISTFGATLASAAVGIAMAYGGFGIWALVAQSIISNVVGTVILWIAIPWRPKKEFSLARVKGLFGYGSKLLLGNLINVGYNDLRQLLIGKVYTTADLAFFNRGATLPGLCNNVITNGANGVLLPTMSVAQESPEEVRALVKKSIRVQTYVLLPMYLGLALCAEPLIRILFSETWIEAAAFQKVFCFMYMLECVANTNTNALRAMGYSGRVLIIECIKTPLYTVILLLTMPYGTMAIAVGSLVGCVAGVILCVLPGKKAYGYSLFQQFRDILPHILLTGFMGVCVWAVMLLKLNDLLTLVLQVAVGVTVYITASAALKMECFQYVKTQLLALVRRK